MPLLRLSPLLAPMAVICDLPEERHSTDMAQIIQFETFAKYAQLLMFSCDGIQAYTNGYAHLYLQCDICQIFDDNRLLNSVRFE